MAIRIRRRDFLVTLGGAAATWSLAAHAQQVARLPVIGFLGTNTAQAQSRWTAAFVQRLRELGWTEDRTVVIEYRWAEGRNERFFELATELVRLKVDVIVTSGTAVTAAKQATSIVPIVFAVATDPVGSGFVESLARPGGNVTGLSLQQSDIAGKRLELLHNIIPNLGRLAIIANLGVPGSVGEMREVQGMAPTLGLDVITLGIRQPTEIATAFDALKDRAQALYVVNDSLTVTNRTLINTLALAARLPTMHGSREQVEAGGLISYGANFPDLFRRAADFVDKILRGAKPSEIPVEQPTQFELVINLRAAKALGLDIPPSLLARADEVIE
jgi:putative tryptophan/tyrosine transport system substrate-binding protein